MMRRVEMVPHDPRWKDEFEEEARRLRAVFGEELLAIHHIGSTAIPCIPAKPIVYILPVVHDIERVDALNDAMKTLGYEAWRESGLPGRRYFTRDEAGTRIHNVHTFQTGSLQITRHLAFRDYMNAHPEEARAYGRLKEKLARKHSADLWAYMDGKHAFVQERERRALAWERETGR